MQKYKSTLSGWGNYPTTTSYLSRPERVRDLKVEKSPLIARGLGRSYGDAALNTESHVILMERMNCFLSFDEVNGLLTAEAGASLEDILNTFVPRGWFLPVTPGTKYVTLGGCLAADIHGKNHHIDGTFSKFVRGIKLLVADGTIKTCSPENNSELFWATVGGMGLTGIITEISLQLLPIETAYMVVRHHPAANLETALQILESSSHMDKYSVAWIDCLSQNEKLGRSIVMNGHHAIKEELPSRIINPLKTGSRFSLDIPFNCPGWLLNSWSIKNFNSLYYRMQSKKEEPFIIDYDRYFYPLDALGHWNRLYGKKGFTQYQFVIPRAYAQSTIRKILQLLNQNQCASFLAVLKSFGPEGNGLLSFPTEGYTLALDIPLADAKVLPLLDLFDEIVLENAGRVYLAKDARMKPASFRAMYPKFSQWKKIKSSIDPNNNFSSDLSRRLEITK